MRELDYGKMGNRIRQVRKAKGWSQDELAKKCGISMSFLGHIERGTRIMDTDADEMLWGVAHASNAVLDMFRSPDSEQKEKKRESDSYSMYVRIMKSVAEIMNEA